MNINNQGGDAEFAEFEQAGEVQVRAPDAEDAPEERIVGHCRLAPLGFLPLDSVRRRQPLVAWRGHKLFGNG